MDELVRIILQYFGTSISQCAIMAPLNKCCSSVSNAMLLPHPKFSNCRELMAATLTPYYQSGIVIKIPSSTYEQIQKIISSDAATYKEQYVFGKKLKPFFENETKKYIASHLQFLRKNCRYPLPKYVEHVNSQTCPVPKDLQVPPRLNAIIVGSESVV